MTAFRSVAQAVVQGRDHGSLHLKLLGSSNPPTSAFGVAGTTGKHNCAQLIFIFIFCKDAGSPYVAQAGLKLLASSNPPTLASKSTEITGVSHHIQHKY